MKHTTILFSSMLVLSLASCKSQKQTTTSGPVVTSEPTVYKGVTDQGCAVEMAFGSFGSGIDGKAITKVNELIESKKLKSSSKSVGREGETRICLPLTELKDKEKEDFIEQLKKIAKEGQLVSVSIR